jgi:hypothetical protein
VVISPLSALRSHSPLAAGGCGCASSTGYHPSSDSAGRWPLVQAQSRKELKARSREAAKPQDASPSSQQQPAAPRFKSQKVQAQGPQVPLPVFLLSAAPLRAKPAICFLGPQSFPFGLWGPKSSAQRHVRCAMCGARARGIGHVRSPDRGPNNESTAVAQQRRESERPDCVASWLGRVIQRAGLLLQATSWSLGYSNFNRFLHTQRVNWVINSARLFPTTPGPRKQPNSMYQTTSAVVLRGDLRQRGDRLLVTHADPFLQLLVLADALSAQLVPVRTQLFSTSL